MELRPETGAWIVVSTVKAEPRRSLSPAERMASTILGGSRCPITVGRRHPEHVRNRHRNGWASAPCDRITSPARLYAAASFYRTTDWAPFPHCSE